MMTAQFNPYRKWLGIASKDLPPNHYRLLGLELFESDPDVIANAADRQMSHIRTFQSGRHSEASQKLLNELSAARICLLDPERKAEYDGRLRAQRVEVQKRKMPPPPAPASLASDQSLTDSKAPIQVVKPAQPVEGRSTRRSASSTRSNKLSFVRCFANAWFLTFFVLVVCFTLVFLVIEHKLQQHQEPDASTNERHSFSPRPPAPPLTVAFYPAVLEAEKNALRESVMREKRLPARRPLMVQWTLSPFDANSSTAGSGNSSSQWKARR